MAVCSVHLRCRGDNVSSQVCASGHRCVLVWASVSLELECIHGQCGGVLGVFPLTVAVYLHVCVYVRECLCGGCGYVTG